MKLRVRAKGVRNNDKEEIEDADHETGGEAERGFAPMRRDAERNADQRENQTGNWKREAFVDLGAAGAAHLRIVGLELVEELFQRKHGTAGPAFFFFVKVL